MSLPSFVQFFPGIARTPKEIEEPVFDFRYKKLLQETLGAACLHYGEVFTEKQTEVERLCSKEYHHRKICEV